MAIDLTQIVLLVPDHYRSMAEENRSQYSKPVAVETYRELQAEHLRRVEAMPVILVSELPEFYALQGENGRFSGGTPIGKVLLDATGEELSRVRLNITRGVDVVERQTLCDVWAFRVNKAIADIEYDSTIHSLREDDLKKQRDLDTLNEIGMALSTEKDLDRLLDMIVSKCREMTWADAGTLYMVEADPELAEDPNHYFANKKMRFKVAQNDSRKVPYKSFLVDIKKSSVYGYVALTQSPLNIPDAYFIDENAEYGWGGKEFDASINYRTMSMLTVPMVNWRGETIGVIQLINRKVAADVLLEDPETSVQYIRPFTEHDERMAMSIASQASIAIQNTQLVQSIRELFDGFIAASVKAIESRDPTTSGHSQRVATLTCGLAEAVDQSDLTKFRDVHFTREQIQEIRYASLLHDFGKIGVREHVLVKAKKLYPEELQSVRDRFSLIRREVQLQYAKQQVQLLLESDRGDHAVLEQTQAELQKELERIDQYWQFVQQCNEPTVMAQGGFEQLSEIASQTLVDEEGQELPFINEKELISLSVPKGSLNEQDRKEIESHVTHTYKFLTTIPWTGDLRNVPDIAYAHHEKLDGTGYPNRLTEEQIPIESKMMTIADIFDALTALDRPYKKALPTERALNILVEEANAHHVDADLLDLFISAELYRLVAQGQQQQ